MDTPPTLPALARTLTAAADRFEQATTFPEAKDALLPALKALASHLNSEAEPYL